MESYRHEQELQLLQNISTILDQSIERLIYDRADAATIRKRAAEIGMRSLRDDGIRKAACGLTTIKEVLRLTVDA